MMLRTRVHRHSARGGRDHGLCLLAGVQPIAILLATVAAVTANAVPPPQTPGAASTSSPPSVVAATGSPEPTAEAAVLELSDDGFLLGKPAASDRAGGDPRTTFHWKSPLFADAIEFRLDGIRRIRFMKQPAPAPPTEPWRAELQGGDVAIGRLESIDADHVVMAVPALGGGPLRIRRAAVARLARPSPAVAVIVPGDAAGWEGSGAAVREQAGRLILDQPGSMVARDVAAPARACHEITISWDERPEFELVFAVGTGKPKPDAKAGSPEEHYRMEAIGGDLLAIREGATAKFESIRTLAAAAGSLQLQVFIDQDRGRLAVVSAGEPGEGRLLFDETVAPRKPTAQGGFGIRLRRGGLRIDGLRVVPWTAEEPRLPKTGDFGGPDAAVESFDGTTGVFRVRSNGGVREVPKSEVSTIEFPTPAAALKPTPGSVLAVFHGGTRLSGKILGFSSSGLRLGDTASAEPIECEFARIAMIEPLARSPLAVPGRPGMLEAAGGRVLGCLVSADKPGTAIGWQPRGSVAAVAIGPEATMRIRYRGLTAIGGIGIDFTKQGQEWVVTNVIPDGPAARDGRVQRGWKLASIRFDHAERPIQANDVKPAELQNLLRGVTGSSVHLVLRDAAGTETMISLPRDASGRGDLGGVSEKDLLEQAIAAQTASNPASAPSANRATVYLKTGDSIQCTVLSAGPEGARVRTDLEADVLVPSVAMRAMELTPTAAGSIPKDKFARLLTLPRMQQADPPTQMLRLPSGDYLRGKLVSLDDSTVRFDVLGTVKELPRSQAARLIWLSVAGDDSQQRAAAAVMGTGEPGSLPVRGTMTDGRRLSFAATGVDGDRLVGRNGVFGATSVDLARCDHLDLGRAAAEPPPTALPYSQWQLKPAAAPRALGKP